MRCTTRSLVALLPLIAAGACSKKDTGVPARSPAAAGEAAPGAKAARPAVAESQAQPQAQAKGAAPAAPELIDIEKLDLGVIPTQSEADAEAAARITEENWQQELEKLERQLAGGDK